MILSSLRFLDTFPISTDLSHMPNTPLNLGYTGEHVTHCGTKYARDTNTKLSACAYYTKSVIKTGVTVDWTC